MHVINSKISSPEFVEQKVRSLAKLSTLPFVAVKVMELVENPRTSASKLCDIISADQVLAARILKLANSAYYGFPRKIATLNLAIVVLGFNALRDLVLSISIIDRFNVNDEITIDLEQFWRHALIIGRGAKSLAKFLNYPVAGEVFVAGLLHDIGYLVLMQEFANDFRKAYEYAHENELLLSDAEEEVLGYTHNMVGAWLTEGWNLPEKLVQAIRHHHSPEKALAGGDLVKIIHLADQVAYSIGEGNGMNLKLQGGVEGAQAALENYFDNSNYTLSFYQDKFREEGEKVGEFLSLLTNK